jgi:ABC-2 type transport system permease protein
MTAPFPHLPYSRLPFRRLWRAHAALTARILLRQPGFWGPTLVLPAMLYLFFGAGMGGDGPLALKAVSAFAVYGVASVAFFQFGVGIAQDKVNVFSEWTTTLPGSLWANWTAQITVSAGFSSAAVVMVLLVAHLTGSYSPSLPMALTILMSCLVGSIPAGLMGCVLGMIAPARAAPGIAMMLFLPLAYIGGLWIPPDLLPALVEAVSGLTPLRHMANWVWAVTDGNAAMALRALLAMFLDCLVLIGVLLWLVPRGR